MKNRVLQLLVLLNGILITTSSYAQSASLDINNIRARVDANTLFNDPNNFLASFEVPKRTSSSNPIYTSIYAASLWLAGKDSSGAIKSNVSTYYNANQLIAGPIMTSSLYSTDGPSWDWVWKVDCYQIQTFAAWYQAGVDDALNGTSTQATNFPGYTIPTSISSWPGNGDTTKGQALKLAPFFDRNGDNLYTPSSGDYPLIKGDEAIFFIFNDERPFYAGTSTLSPMKTEVHGMAYAYISSDSAINNTIFVDYTIYNRSNLTYDSTYVGIWTDLDIGNSTDDYIGCDVARSTFYGYNGDANDENVGGINGYGIYPPAQGITFLQGAKQNNDGTDNAFGIGVNETINGTGFGDGIIDNEYWGMEHFIAYNNGSGVFLGDGDPQTNGEYYNYLKGFWRNGSQLVWGGNGNTASGGTIPTKHLFPGTTDPLWYGTGGIATTPINWSENGVPGDRRGLGSTGPFTLKPDSSISITLAFVFGRDYQTTGVQAGIIVMQERIDSIKSYYTNGTLSSCNATIITGIGHSKLRLNKIHIYPNPFDNEFTINYQLQKKIAILEIYNLIGEKITSRTITQNTTVIDLTAQPSGIYFVTITDGNNRVSKKVIKQ